MTVRRSNALCGRVLAAVALVGVLLAVLCAVMLAAGASSAFAATSAAPGWTLSSHTVPTSFSAGDDARCEAKVNEGLTGETLPCDRYEVVATDAGSEPASAGATLTMVLPGSVTVQSVVFELSGVSNGLAGLCETEPEAGRSTVTCGMPIPVAPDQKLRMLVEVTVNAGVSEGAALTAVARISGGGAATVESEASPEVSSVLPPFGPSSFDFYISGLDGLPYRQAGGHPYELTVTAQLNSDMRPLPEEGTVGATSVQDLREVVVQLPLGFAASDLAAPQCTLAQLGSHDGCPPDTQVGYLQTYPAGAISVESPIWNIVPERGVAGEFGYRDTVDGAHIFYAHVVPTPHGYVIQATSPDIPQVNLTGFTATFYGDPASRDGTGNAQVPYFTLPTDCAGGAVTATIFIDSWQHPGAYNQDGTIDTSDPDWVRAESSSPPVLGCDLLRFEPQLLAQPTTLTADSPTGLEFEMKVPQSEQFETSGTPALDDATVTFPEGMTVDPSSGQGLQACSESQIGWKGGTPENFNALAPVCPEASKIGSLELETPLIPGKLEGAVYLAAQNENPFASVLAIYVVIDDPATGVVLKIAGELKSDEHTGRLTSYFPENAQLPFSDLKLHFFGGPRAELATPSSCGTFTTTSVLAPWSAPDSGPNAEPASSFTVGEGCVDRFEPTFTAGSTNLQAGAFTDFVASFSREDQDRDMGDLSVTLPPGLLANVGSVPECPQAQVEAARDGTGECPADSRVGTVTAGAGPGPDPLFVGGNAYLTGPYKGGPYGLAVVVPAVAGPFHLGNVVVRQSLQINESTAQVTDVSDPFPTFLDPVGANAQTAGIPIDLRRVDVDIDREGFAFNPTSCGRLAVTASMSSTAGEARSLESPFQVSDCAGLKFTPKFTVSTSGQTSKADGASLTAKVTEPSEGQGAQANIARVKVELPLQLPSRLSTLQRACLSAQFETNPAGCPAASFIGHAIVHTPILPVPLEGPVIFVSHGGEAFPSLEIVLQGDGVTVDLVGTTLISKAGVTSTTFKAVPDTPFATFELTLPEGPYSALAANGSLCKPTSTKTVEKTVTSNVDGSSKRVRRKVTETVASTLQMPSEFVAQNGLELRQDTPISVTGCPKASAAAKKAHTSRKKEKG